MSGRSRVTTRRTSSRLARATSWASASSCCSSGGAWRAERSSCASRAVRVWPTSSWSSRATVRRSASRPSSAARVLTRRSASRRSAISLNPCASSAISPPLRPTSRRTPGLHRVHPPHRVPQSLEGRERAADQQPVDDDHHHHRRGEDREIAGGRRIADRRTASPRAVRPRSPPRPRWRARCVRTGSGGESASWPAALCRTRRSPAAGRARGSMTAVSRARRDPRHAGSPPFRGGIRSPICRDQPPWRPLSRASANMPRRCRRRRRDDETSCVSSAQRA